MPLLHRPPVHLTTLPDHESINRSLLSALERELAGGTHVRQSHYELGRYENTYIEADAIPEIAPVRAAAFAAAREILQLQALKLGFWFNVMQAGDRTARHNHEEQDELLSCVYYLRAPPDCGDLLLYPPEGTLRITPLEGRFVLFSPRLAHAVAENRSGERRVSVAFNFGRAESS